ncbi:spermidine synthase [Flexivirga sp. B27]
MYAADSLLTRVRRAESERGEVVLRRRVTGSGQVVLELRVNGVFVMDTLQTDTERALAGEALALSSGPRRVLVGGLGLGFTARELLADQRVRRVDVVELEQALIDWTRDGTVPDGGMLADDRLRIIRADIADAVREAAGPTYDLVLLDVDNGPGYLVHADNAAIYRAPFLRQLHDVLRPGGVLVVWSADAAPELLTAMRAGFDDVQERPIDVRLGDRAEHYYLYAGRVRALAPGESV